MSKWLIILGSPRDLKIWKDILAEGSPKNHRGFTLKRTFGKLKRNRHVAIRQVLESIPKLRINDSAESAAEAVSVKAPGMNISYMIHLNITYRPLCG